MSITGQADCDLVNAQQVSSKKYARRRFPSSRKVNCGNARIADCQHCSLFPDYPFKTTGEWTKNDLIDTLGM